MIAAVYARPIRFMILCVVPAALIGGRASTSGSFVHRLKEDTPLIEDMLNSQWERDLFALARRLPCVVLSEQALPGR